MEATFSDDEKRFVLGEIIKVSAIDVPTLVDFIRAHKIEPNWMSMQLPGGRNMNQCIGAVENMFHAKFPPPNVSTLSKRKSLGDLVDHPAKRQAITVPFEPSLAPIRALQPRPPLAPPHASLHANGYPSPMAPTPAASGATTTTATTTTTTGKKRGRPSKADKEAQAQARAAYSRPGEYTPITPALVPLAPAAVQPQREYASSPGYELSSNGPDPASKNRPRPSATDSPRQAGASFPLISPASTTGTPRAFPDASEQLERTNMSPPGRNSAPVDSRSPQLAPLNQHVAEQPQTHVPMLLPRPQSHPAAVQPSTRPLQTYETYKGPDPIFPDRDRSRSIPSQTTKNPTPPPPVMNRT